MQGGDSTYVAVALMMLAHQWGVVIFFLKVMVSRETVRKGSCRGDDESSKKRSVRG